MVEHHDSAAGPVAERGRHLQSPDRREHPDPVAGRDTQGCGVIGVQKYLVALACREPVSQRQVLAVYRSTMSSSPALQTVLLALREAAEAVGGGTAADAVVAKQGAR